LKFKKYDFIQTKVLYSELKAVKVKL